MNFKKLRFTRMCEIDFEGEKIECRIVYGDFPYGYVRDGYLIPEIVVDKKGEAYRPITVCSDGPWCIVTDAYLKRVGLSRKQIRSAA